MPRHIYIHVPFCARRCSYCDFSIAVRRDVPVAEYLAALRAELQTRFGAPAATPVDTLYFGGGTPSRLGGAGLAECVALVREYFEPVFGAEITIEANPDDVDAESARDWAAAGVNRVSLGTQSFDERVLAWMHRNHGAGAAERAVEALRGAGITNLSLDLIFALPEALERDYEADVRRLLALQPQHVSLYGLTVERGTPLGRWVERGVTVERAEDGYAADYLAAHAMLAAAGYEHYEVSNYGKPGFQARHNSAYWANAPYVGIGPAAHGFDGAVRRWNTRHYAAWRGVALDGHDPVEGTETLTTQNRQAEEVYLGLRSSRGLVVAPADHGAIAPWIDAGWAVLGDDARLRCTPEGWLRLDALAAALTHHRSR